MYYEVVYSFVDDIEVNGKARTKTYKKKVLIEALSVTEAEAICTKNEGLSLQDFEVKSVKIYNIERIYLKK